MLMREHGPPILNPYKVGTLYRKVAFSPACTNARKNWAAQMIPDYQSLMLPLLRLSEDGREHRVRDVIEPLANQLGRWCSSTA
jgi:hypothetical protein